MRFHASLFLPTLLVLATSTGCQKENLAGETAPVPGALKRTETAKVRVLPVLVQEMVSALETTTVVESERHVIIHPESAGIVRELLAEEGDHVKQGQVLARLDSRDATAALEDSRIALQEAEDNEAKGQIARRDAEANIEKARLSLDQAKRDYDRNEQAKMISALEIERLKLAMDVAEQDLTASILAKDRSEIEGRAAATAINRAQLAVDRAGLTLSYTELVAPFDGVLTDRTMQTGDNVGPSTEAFTITDLNDLRTRFYRPQRELGLFTGLGPAMEGDAPSPEAYEGIEVSATSEALPGYTFGGVIERISPNIDSASGSFRLTVRLEEESGGVRLLPGMLLRLRMITERHPNAITVSKRSLRREGDTTILFLAVDGKARRVEVTEGFSAEEYVEVFPREEGALEAGTSVIVVGNRDLEDGRDIEIRPWDDEGGPANAPDGAQDETNNNDEAAKASSDQ
jgi:membrane fusion protein (multidrug efflux system)